VIAFALRSVLVRPRRAAMTTIAVVIGVALIAGTFVFTDTINAAFRQLFGASTTGAEVIVSSRQDVTSPLTAPATMPAALVTKIAALSDVAAAQGQIADVATIVGRNGKAVNGLGSHAIALSYVPSPFSGMGFLHGRPPSGPGEVALDEATARAQHYRVGDLVPILTAQPERRFTVSGIFRFGTVPSGGDSFAVFDPASAAALFEKQGRFDSIYVAGARGAAPAALVREIQPLLSPELVARTSAGQVDTDLRRIHGQLGLLTGGLLAFGCVAVLLAAIAIFNTFSITVAGRMHEFAMLRALGATRGQIRRAVPLEAGLIGTLASAAGLGLGVLAAIGIRKLFGATGLSLPSTSPVLAQRTIAIAFGVGVLVTIVAGLVPALRATRATPLEALRAGRTRARRSAVRRWFMVLLAGLLTAGGAVLIFATSGTTTRKVAASATGAALMVVALVALSPLAIRPLTRLIAWPLERGGRILGRLARENTTRDPARTAVTASSLMVGLALVLFVTIYASGLRAASTRAIERTYVGDFTVESQDGISPIPSSAARAVAVVPDVLAISTLKTATARLGTATRVTAAGVDPTTIGNVYRFDWAGGPSFAVPSLGFGDVLVERQTARDAGLQVGDTVTLTTETGLEAPVRVRGIYADRALMPGFVMPLSRFDQLFHQDRLQDVFIKLTPGADRAAAGVALDQALASYPGVVARSDQQLRDEVGGRVDRILVLFYALLAISVLVSLLGIVNTMTLSVHERTRELGMLRAVGMTRAQARTLIRDESMITATIGTLIGVAIGVFLAWVVSRALADEEIAFALPWPQLALVVGLGLIAGVVASIVPARRAARLDVLAAIAQE
jgi:putative ABC transport system permease protein